LVLGGGEVKLLELTNAFAVFARGGNYLPTVSILKVEDSRGTILEKYEAPEPEQILNEGVAYQINSILTDNISRSFIFGTSGPLVVPGHTVAVKTGTTNDSRDGWCIGYTPSLAVGVWSGNNDNTPMTTGVASYYTSAPLWNEFMSEMLKDKPDEQFKKPKNIVTLEVDALTGLLPTKNCPGNRKKEIFVKNLNEPTENCDKVYTTVKIDKISKKLATELTPEAAIIEKTFIVIHSEFPNRPNWENPVVAWAKKNGYYNPPPTEYDDVHIEKNKPTITITSPENGALVSGNFNIEVSATAPKGVKQIAFYIDDFLIGKKTSPPFSITYNTNSQSGNKIIKVILLDKIYFTAEATISVTFNPDTQPPNEISNLNANAESGKISLSWTNPPDFDLSKVFIYRGVNPDFTPGEENKIAQIVVTPNLNSNFIDTNINPGTYYYIIKTVDRTGNQSMGVSIAVIAP
jgi:membrane carboxypeptidase/penicillin-binding protein PbpC